MKKNRFRNPLRAAGRRQFLREIVVLNMHLKHLHKLFTKMIFSFSWKTQAVNTPNLERSRVYKDAVPNATDSTMKSKFMKDTTFHVE